MRDFDHENYIIECDRVEYLAAIYENNPSDYNWNALRKAKEAMQQAWATYKAKQDATATNVTKGE